MKMLTNNITGYDFKLKILKEDLEDVESEIENLGKDRDYIKEQIKALENQIKQSQTYKTKQGFERDFYTAALFCNHFDDRNHNFDCVHVLPNKLQATSPFAAIEITCDTIPETLHNKIISWRTDDFEKAESKTGTFLNVSNLFTEVTSDLNNLKVMSKAEIEHLMLGDGVTKTSKDYAQNIMAFMIGNIQIGFRRELIEIAMLSLQNDEDITVRWSTALKPIIFSTDKVKAMIFPVKLWRNKVEKQKHS